MSPLEEDPDTLPPPPPPPPHPQMESLAEAALPLETVCDAIGVPGELVQELYREAVFPFPMEEHEEQSPAVASGDEMNLVVVAEAELDAAAAIAAADETPVLSPRPSFGNEEETPTDENRPLLGAAALPPHSSLSSSPRRRVHVRDVSLDFAHLLESIPEKKTSAPPAEGPTTRDEEAPPGTAHDVEGSVLLDDLMERANSSFRGEAPFAASSPGGGSLRNFFSGGEGGGRSFRLGRNGIEMSPALPPLAPGRPALPPLAPGGSTLPPLAPGVPRKRAGTHDSGSISHTLDQHASLVILNAAAPAAAGGPSAAFPAEKLAHPLQAHDHPPVPFGAAAGPEMSERSHRGHHTRGAGSIIPDALLVPLERGLSILPGGDVTLPSDVREVTLEIDRHMEIAPDDKGEGAEAEAVVEVHLVVKRAAPMVGYLLLAFASFALSTVGPVLDIQKGVTPSLKAYWRMCATWMALLPFALRAVARDGGLPKLSREQWVSTLWLGLGYAMCAEFFVLALSLTSVLNASIFANTHVLLFVLIKVVTGTGIACQEGVGALVGFAGAVLAAWGGSLTAAKSDGGAEDRRFLAAAAMADEAAYLSYVGDALALVSACGTVLYLSVAKRLRPHMDLFLCMFLQFFIASIWLLAMMIAKGEVFELSIDPQYGLFGWMCPRADRLPIELWLVFICNFGGIVGYVAAMKYFEPIVISCCQNTQPVLSSFVAAVVGVEPFPGPVALVGDAIVFGGTYMVISSESRSTEVTDLKAKARERGYNVAD